MKHGRHEHFQDELTPMTPAKLGALFLLKDLPGRWRQFRLALALWEAGEEFERQIDAVAWFHGMGRTPRGAK